MANDSIIDLQKSQKAFFQSRKTFSIEFRLNALQKLNDLIVKNSTEILLALKQDLNKSETESYTSEINYVLNEIKFFIKNLKKLSKPVKIHTPLINRPGKSYYIHEPFGTVLIISPWNYPFGLLFSPLVGAIAAGNCVIAKPSEIATNTSKLVKKILSEKFNDEYIAVVEGGADITQSLINENINYIFFTGSTAVGKKIMKSAAKYLIPVSLELGGKNPCIVDSDIDLEVTAKRIVWGKFFNAGQTCVAPDYILVHKDIKKVFLEKLKTVIDSFYENNPDNFCHIINEKHFERLSDLLKEGTIYCGGNKDKSKLYLSPTVILDIDFNSKVMEQEIFGPILPVIEYVNLSEIIETLNQLSEPLATYFFSKNKVKQDELISKIRTGSVCINGTIHTLFSSELPFGGIGQSGMGKYHGKFSYETFSYKKAIVKKSFVWDMKQIYPPYKTSLDLLKKALKFIS